MFALNECEDIGILNMFWVDYPTAQMFVDSIGYEGVRLTFCLIGFALGCVRGVMSHLCSSLDRMCYHVKCANKVSYLLNLARESALFCYLVNAIRLYVP